MPVDVCAIDPVDEQVDLLASWVRASGRLARLLAERLARFNAGVRETAGRYGALVIDLEPVEALTDRRFWHSDRLHLNAAGHERVMAAVLGQLGVDDLEVLGGPVGWWREPLPPKPAATRREDLTADVVWVRDHLVPWAGRRLRGVSSGDGREPKDPRPRLLPVGESRAGPR